MARPFCVLCDKKHQDFNWKFRAWEISGGKKLLGWACSKYFIPSGKKSTRRMMEDLATPFWRHMGLPPKSDEIEAEKRMKWEGKTYLDLQRQRLAKANQTFDSTALKKKLMAGKLKSKKPSEYVKKGNL